MIARGFQSHSIHPRGSEVSQMDLHTTKTRYVKVGTNVCFFQSHTSLQIETRLKTLSLGLLAAMVKGHDSSFVEIYSYCIHLFSVFLKRLASPSVEKRCAYSPTPERGRTTTQHRQERRDRDHERASENKENIAVPVKDVEIFALPPPRTPVSSKKTARPNKNVLTTPNQNANANGAKTNAVSPKGKRGLSLSQPVAVMKYRQCRVSAHHTVYLYTVIVFCSKQGL